MSKLPVAVIGAGRLGLACAEGLIDETELGLACVVRRAGSPAPLPGRLQRFPVTSHVRKLKGVCARTGVCTGRCRAARDGSAAHDHHESLLLEARFDANTFSAGIMFDATRKLPGLCRGAHATPSGSEHG